MKIILFSTIIVTSLFYSSLWLYHFVTGKRLHDDAYSIVALLQTGPKKEALPTAYLAELLHLSQDKKINFYAFDEKEAEKTLLTSPLIKKALVKKIYPDTVYIDYTAREPIALVYDYENIAIDEEGYLFPITPFLTPKKLPQIYFGLLPFGQLEDDYGRKGGCFGHPLQTQGMQLAFSLLHTIDAKLIDVSSAFSDSFGRREIVLVLEDSVHKEKEDKLITYLFPRILRLSVEHYEEDLKRYNLLKEKLLERALVQGDNRVKGCIIDLRLKDLAFIH